jgi:hypothetical protein
MSSHSFTSAVHCPRREHHSSLGDWNPTAGALTEKRRPLSTSSANAAHDARVGYKVTRPITAGNCTKNCTLGPGLWIGLPLKERRAWLQMATSTAVAESTQFIPFSHISYLAFLRKPRCPSIAYEIFRIASRCSQLILRRRPQPPHAPALLIRGR